MINPQIFRLSLYLRSVQKLRVIAKDQKWLTIGLGIVIGLFILTSSIDFADEASVKSDATEQEQTVITELEVEAMPSASQQSVERNSYLIEVIPEYSAENEEVVDAGDLFLPSPAKIFEVVSEHIISPNSP